MKWTKREAPPHLVKDIAERYSLDLLSASILARRGLRSPGDFLFFLETDERWLHNPFYFAEMEDAVDRINLARDEGEKVLVFGDRDVDGITSTVLLVETLTAMGIETSWRVPQEEEKYGITKAAIDDHARNYGSLIITVDCGISSHDELDHAAGLGIDVIILDHHVLQAPEPPEAIAVINPKLPDSPYPFRELSGCGVVYKLVWALKFAATEFYKQDIALLNVRPLEESYIVEAIALSNLIEEDRISESIVPGMIDLETTRLVPFLKNRQIFVWDGELQKKLLAKAFGKAASVECHDIRPEVARIIPQTAGQSLLRLGTMSRSGKYSEEPQGELDVFQNLFLSFALKTFMPEPDYNALQLAALSTVADLMPLLDENRTIVQLGLAAMNKKPRKGIVELLARQNTNGKQLNAVDCSWIITPVINAAGRMGQPEIAVRLFLEDNPDERSRLADRLVEMNAERREMGADSWGLAFPQASAAMEKSGNKYIMLGSEEIQRGVTGVLATRLSEHFQVPAIIASFLKDGTVTGSLRTARGFKVKAFLEKFSGFFIDYGGHDAAAGFYMDGSNWPEFQRETELFFASVSLDDFEKSILLDAELPHDYLNPELATLVDRFEPYGEGNPKLVFMAKAVTIVQADILGKPEKIHLKLTLRFGKTQWPALWWKEAERLGREFAVGDRLDIAFELGKNFWNGMESLQLIVLDARKTAEENS